MYNGEIVLGVKRSHLESILVEEFGYIDGDKSYEAIQENLEPMDREAAETDETFKQVIPYLFIKYDDKYLMYRRTKETGEKRLAKKLSLGVGGHINPIDVPSEMAEAGFGIIELAMTRELAEEISIVTKNVPQFQGIINDDRNEVGRVHLGMVFKAESTSPMFGVLETDKMVAEWVTKDFIKENYDEFETWSQIVYDSLIEGDYTNTLEEDLDLDNVDVSEGAQS